MPTFNSWNKIKLNFKKYIPYHLFLLLTQIDPKTQECHTLETGR